MPIHEIKNPQPPPPPPPPERREVPQVHGVPPVIRIRHYGGQKAGRGSRRERASREGIAAGHPSVRLLVDKVNADLERQQAPVHLVLLEKEDGWTLEIYDCTDGELCQAVKDLEISPAELPLLLQKLQRETGLLIDTLF